MQVTETKNDGLKRSFNVTVDSKALQDEMDTQLRAMAGRVKIPGFRPGHIPMNILKQRYGKNVLGEVLERTVNRSSAQLLRDRNLRAALPPKIDITSAEEGEDLTFVMDVELLPEVPAVDFAAISLTKPVCHVEDAEVDEALTRLAQRNKKFTRAGKGAKAKMGSQLMIDFVGKVNDVAFEGGTAKGYALELGSGYFINGFEEQLVGTKEGDEVLVKVTFPESYHKADLAGQPATFDVTVHEVRESEEAKPDADLAKALGFKELESLRKAIQDQIAAEYDSAARAQMKKALFDELENICTFPIPQGMLDMEFNAIWEKLQVAKKEGDEMLAGKSDDELRTEYTKIAERRVKLGILLSDVALKNHIQVNQDELSRAVMQQASQFPGQERRIFEYYQQNPRQLEELRGPILEEKAVDFIFGKAKLTEKKVSPKDLTDDEQEQAAEEEPKKKPAAKTKKKASNE